MYILGTDTRRLAPGHHPAWEVLQFEGLASGSDRENVAVTVEPETPFLFVVIWLKGVGAGQTDSVREWHVRLREDTPPESDVTSPVCLVPCMVRLLLSY